MPPAIASPDARLHVVTGKGGTGKTSVAAALALALAQRPARVLVSEVESRQGISQVLDVSPLGPQETTISRLPNGGELVGLAVDAKAALLEYLDLFYKLGRAGKLLEKVGAIDFAATIAPGVRDLLTIGKIYEASRRRADGRHRGASPLLYDAIVLDAPPTGRIGRFLSVGSEVADLARIGPIRNQADSITALLTGPSTVVHLVTILEEMPVQETLEAIDELRERGLHVGSVIVNMVREPFFDDTALAQARDGRLHKASISTQLRDAGLVLEPALVDGLLAQAQAHAERVDMESTQRELLLGNEIPVVELPLVPGGIDVDAVHTLARALRPALVAKEGADAAH